MCEHIFFAYLLVFFNTIIYLLYTTDARVNDNDIIALEEKIQGVWPSERY